MTDQQQATMNKIVNVNEFSDKLQEQLKVGLSFGQVMSLTTTGTALSHALKSAYQIDYIPEGSPDVVESTMQSSLKALFKNVNNDDTLGLFTGKEAGENYISGASVQVMAQIMLDYSTAEGESAEKILNAVSQAFCESEGQNSKKATFAPVC